jgi:hypothetical protein
MLDYQFRPIVQWPGEKTRNRRRSQFNTLYSKTLQLLERELEFLRAKQVVIQADCEASEIRRDGQLRADARLRGPGVILTFESSKGPLSFPCDTYPDWQDNIRAIALALEALRAVDRYGVTRRAEQYKGWSRLPAPETNEFPSVHDAAAFILQASAIAGAVSNILQFMDSMARHYRYAAARLHPDRNNGSSAEFVKLQAAKAMLDKHFASKGN